jgi:hypothetical protein
VSPASTTLKLATGNLEWMLSPATFSALKGSCSGNDAERRIAQRQLPCDVAASLERSAVDSSAMARYARALDADVIALQEVDGAAARAGAWFAVLGAFNRDLLAERGAARAAHGAQRNVWAEINDGEPRGAVLRNAAAGESFRNCAIGQNHNGYIDQIILGEKLAALQVPGSFERLTWEARDTAKYKLSDHCPIAIRLKLPPPD